ncbi:MAG: glycosyltransferase family 39 protein [Acetobacter sp.]|nr:glycosyltransferase family 39 protein [Acetobacter sp.]
MANPTEKTFLKSLYLNLPKLYFVLQILVGIWLSFWLLYNHQPKTGDDVEHIHSAWLVYQGGVPYQDFFQHHNPLLWYIFAPLVGHFAYNLAIFDVVREISTIVMFFTLFVVGYTVKRFIAYSWYATLLVVAAALPSYVVFSGQDFRPDNYMVTMFMLGLYYFFAYLEQGLKKQLIISFFCMFLSFMFMQKSVFFLAVFAAVVIYQLYAQNVKVKDFWQALILPIALAVLFVCWLGYHGIIERYWLSNFIFNLYIPDVYNGLVEKTHGEFYVLSAIAICGAIYFLYKGNTYARILSLFMLAETVQRFFYFSLDRHYYYFLLILNAMIAGAIAWELIKRYNWTAYMFALLSFWGCLIFKDYCLQNKLYPPYHRYATPKYVIEQTNRCDSVLNGYGLTYGLFSKDITYYWNLNGQLDVIGSQIGLAPLPNLNEAVEKYLPKIIYTGPFWNEKLRKRNIDYPVHIIAPELRDKYYEQSLFVDIFILKPEYQQRRRCRYDNKTNTWNYYNKE